MAVAQDEKRYFAQIMTTDQEIGYRFGEYLNTLRLSTDRVEMYRQMMQAWVKFTHEHQLPKERLWTARLMAFYHHLGFSTKEIADCLNVKEATILRFLEAFPPTALPKTPPTQHELPHTPSFLTWNGAPIIQKQEKQRLRKLLNAFLLILIATSFAASIQLFFGKQQNQQHFIQQIALATPKTLLKSGSPEKIEKMLQSQFNHTADIPLLMGEAELGLGQTFLQGVAAPMATFLLGQNDTTRIKVITLGYQQLDKIKETGLSENVLSGLSGREGQPMLLDRQWEEHSCIIWRWRDDLYFAFVPNQKVKPFINNLSRF